jgi:hypothetical protein
VPRHSQFHVLSQPAATGASQQFAGVVYAPNADVSMGGGGNNTYDFVGSVVAQSLGLNGRFNIHYDENLMRIGPNRGYLVTNWLEI